MCLLGQGPRTEVPGWLWQTLEHNPHVDLREAMSADRLHQEGPRRLSVGRRGILLALGKCLITGDKPQAAPEEEASSKDPRLLASGHPQALHRRRHRHHPSLRLLIIYHRTHSTHFLHRLHTSQYLMTQLLSRDPSGATSRLFSQLLVDMEVEGIVLDRGTLEEGTWEEEEAEEGV